MPSIFDKLNLKSQTEILVVDAPASFEKALSSLRKVRVVRDPRALKTIEFALLFATRQAQVDALSKQVVKKAAADAVLWFAYPKGTSRRYTCDFNRDTGWTALRAAGFDTVRQVAIDEDWTALRFRRTEHIGRATSRRPETRVVKRSHTTAADTTDAVEAFLKSLEHPCHDAILALRQVVRGASPSIHEGIKWNAPSFRTTEYFATMHLRAKSGIGLILHLGAKARASHLERDSIRDPHQLLRWLAKDRAQMSFSDVAAIRKQKSAIAAIIRQWLLHV